MALFGLFATPTLTVESVSDIIKQVLSGSQKLQKLTNIQNKNPDILR